MLIFCYVFQLTVKATYDYEGQQIDELSFCKHAVITNVVKQEKGWWRGDYGGKLQHWFPVNHVEELVEDTHIEKSDSSVRLCFLTKQIKHNLHIFEIYQNFYCNILFKLIF